MTINERTRTRKIMDINEKEDEAFRLLALHYRLPYKSATEALRMFLSDIVDKKVLDNMDEPVNDEYMGIPLNIVNSLARDRFMTNAKPSRAKVLENIKENNGTYNKDNKEPKEYPILLKAAKHIIDLVESGEHVTNKRVRDALKCDYKVAKLAMDTVDNLYKPKNPNVRKGCLQ